MSVCNAVSSGVNVQLNLNRFTHESRILKESLSLRDSGLFKHIYMTGLWEEGLEREEHPDEFRTVVRFKLNSRSLPKNKIFLIAKYLELLWRMIFFFADKGVTVVHCHDLNSLTIAVVFKGLFGCKIVYDSHELATETYGLTGFRKRFAKIIESRLIRFADMVLVVTESIAKWYRNEYSHPNLLVVHNMPHACYGPFPDTDRYNLRLRFSVPAETVLFMYHGALTEGRGLEVICSIFSRLPPDKHVVFMGYGPLETMIQAYAIQHENIHFMPAASPSEIIFFVRHADVTIALADGCSLSRQYALPNKLFESLQGGVPVIVPDFPERGSFIDRYQCGWKVPVRDKIEADVLFESINAITSPDIAKKKKQILSINNQFTWELESREFVARYRNLVDDSRYSCPF